MDKFKPTINNDLTNFSSFIEIPIFVFKIFGFAPFANATILPKRGKLFSFFGFLSQSALSLCFILEILYFPSTENISFVTAINSLLIIAYSGLSLIKSAALVRKRNKTNEFVSDLLKIYPPTKAEQELFNVSKLCQNVNLFFKIFAFFYNLMVSTFYIIPLSKILAEIFSKDNYQLSLPFLMWFPFDPFARIDVYVMLMIFQSWGAAWSGAIQFGSDTMLFAFGIQICMHFDWIRNRLEDFNLNVTNDEQDYNQLAKYIQRHNEIIRY